MKLETLIRAWHYAYVIDTEYHCFDSVTKSRHYRALRQSTVFEGGISKRIADLERRAALAGELESQLTAANQTIAELYAQIAVARIQAKVGQFARGADNGVKRHR